METPTGMEHLMRSTDEPFIALLRSTDAVCAASYVRVKQSQELVARSLDLLAFRVRTIDLREEDG